MLVRLPVKKSYLTMAWDATAKGQTDLALHLFKLAYEQETLPEKKAEAAWNVYVDCKNKENTTKHTSGVNAPQDSDS